VLSHRKRSSLAIGFSLMIVLSHLYVACTSSFAAVWGAWIALIVFAVPLAAMIIASPRLLGFARWLCCIGLCVSAISAIIGLIGILVHSVDLAVYFAIGLTYALLFGLNIVSCGSSGDTILN
jgi:hypothetical protein